MSALRDCLQTEDVLLELAVSSQQHLDMLALVVSLFSDVGFRSALHACRHPEQVKALVEAWSLAAAAPRAAGSAVRTSHNQA